MMKLKTILLATTLALTGAMVAAHAGAVLPNYYLGVSDNGGATLYTYDVGSNLQSFSTDGPITLDGYTVSSGSNIGGNGTGVTAYGYDFNINGSESGKSTPVPLSFYLIEAGIPVSAGTSIAGSYSINDTTAASYMLYAQDGIFNPVSVNGFGTTTFTNSTAPELLYSSPSGTLAAQAFAASYTTTATTYSLGQAFTFPTNTHGNVSVDGAVNVPEPGSLALLGTGLIGLGIILRRRNRSNVRGIAA